jgi:hypothetical protein
MNVANRHSVYREKREMWDYKRKGDIPVSPGYGSTEKRLKLVIRKDTGMSPVFIHNLVMLSMKSFQRSELSIFVWFF